MAIEREKTIDDKTIKIYEMSVTKVREWLKNSTERQNIDLVDCLLFDDFILSDLMFFTSISREEMDGMTPSELRQIIDEVKELNPHFFVMQDRLVTIGQGVMKTLPSAS
ncbi:hypothetical protein [Dechloromonas denitrificans]|uniref:hypothetical protein n=1 Tax=Dechloromonas denitrificans TaxID=281362 RepID=UPI001CFB282D|nr:hypothetical protein [Dechloromonas denitrificans]UCV08468.1 hypothetical protein KI615_02750 [Dechloromonas denitrificans]